MEAFRCVKNAREIKKKTSAGILEMPLLLYVNLRGTLSLDSDTILPKSKQFRTAVSFQRGSCIGKFTSRSYHEMVRTSDNVLKVDNIFTEKLNK